LKAEGNQMKTATVPIGQLRQEPYATVLCFPKPDETELLSRIAELQSHGVEALEFVGKATVFGSPVPVVGKGFVGIVVVAHRAGERLAIKIRRLDADRADLIHEAELLSKANNASVGPKFAAVSKNFLVMQLIEGDLLPDWIAQNKEPVRIKAVLSQILRQCYQLDQAGLDHGELAKAPKHVIIDHQDKPWIVDFETASLARKTANVSAISHFLFNSPGEVAQTIAQILGERNKEKIITTLREYRKSRTEESFEAVLQACLS
jgi:putative serine/threonine protein kinase